MPIDPSRREHVTKKNMQIMEMGGSQILNLTQLKELYRFKPKNVHIKTISDGSFYITTIERVSE